MVILIVGAQKPFRSVDAHSTPRIRGEDLPSCQKELLSRLFRMSDFLSHCPHMLYRWKSGVCVLMRGQRRRSCLSSPGDGKKLSHRNVFAEVVLDHIEKCGPKRFGFGGFDRLEKDPRQVRHGGVERIVPSLGSDVKLIKSPQNRQPSQGLCEALKFFGFRFSLGSEESTLSFAK